ncbi:MAG: cache domain-containing protein [Vicinamibacterales bacterium]
MVRPAFLQPPWSSARIAVGAACIVGAIATLALGLNYQRSLGQTLATARDRARSEADRAAGVIDGELRRFELAVTGVAGAVNSGRPDTSALLEQLRQGIDRTPQMAGLGAAFLPLAHDPNLRLFAPYLRRRGDAVDLIQLDTLYDYLQGNRDWFQLPLKEGRPTWSEPAVADTLGVPAVEFSAPIARGGNAAVGVVHGTMSLTEVNDIVSSLDLGEVGYSFLVSKGGFVISHPFADEYALGMRVFSGMPVDDHGIVEDVIDPVTGEPSWLFTEIVPATGWTLGVVFFKDQSSRSQELRRQQIHFAVALIVTLCLLLALVLEPYRQSHAAVPLWAGAGTGSLVLLLGIAFLWVVSYGVHPPAHESETVFVDKGSVRRFTLDTMRGSLASKGVLPSFVPTGVFIQTMEILSPNNVAVTGYVWQKYARNIPESVARGFVLPDASDREITEAYRTKTADGETIGWYVKATVRQKFDYANYPLDQQEFRLRVWHGDLNRGIVLVPDLEAYKIIHPLARAGIDINFVLPGWAVNRTQFGSSPRIRTTTYGLAAEGDAGTELAFDVVINRRIIEPMFSNLLPLTVSGFMVFSLLLIVKESTRGNVVQTLSAFSGLFFVIILSQLDLRRRVSGASILYIEYYYFVMYGAIVVAALTTLTNGWPGLFPSIERREHFFPKVLFWPVILGVLAVITLVIFY